MQTANQHISIPQRNIPSFKIQFLNLYSLVGMAFFILGTFFVFQFTSTLNKSSFYSFDSNIDTTKGRIIKVAETTFGFGSETGGSHTPIFEYTFTYFARDSSFTNKGYATDASFKVDDMVAIRYKKNNPSLSKADGLRTSHYGLYVLFTIIFPIIGLWLLFKGFKWGSIFKKTLEDGILTEATFQKLEAKDDYFKHYYLFTDSQGIQMTAVDDKNNESITQTVKVIYNKLDSSKSFILNWKSIPLVFGRNRIEDLINCR